LASQAPIHATGKPYLVFKGHSRQVSSVAFSPDGKTVLTGSYDGDVRLWDAQSGQLIRFFNAYTKVVYDVAFSLDGKNILTASGDSMARLWNALAPANEAAKIRTLIGHTDRVTTVAFSPDGSLLLTGSFDRTVRLWDATTGVVKHVFKPDTDAVLNVSFAPDGKSILLAGWGNSVQQYDIGTGQLNLQFSLKNWIMLAEYSPDGRYIVTSSNGESDLTKRGPRLWDAKSGQPIHDFIGFGEVEAAAFSSNSKWLATGDSLGMARVWNVETGELLHTFSADFARLSSVAISPDGKYLLSGSWDSSAWLWVIDLPK
jgi:WD40 repeat protein